MFSVYADNNNEIGQQKLQMLQDHFAVSDVAAIIHGVLWQITLNQEKIVSTTDKTFSDIINAILQTNILFNPYSHDYYEYHYEYDYALS